ncbi:Hypothetical_protein [Hexamita inflata]|uniref:Hypothetical_protein n=1 Tax=Hexamita inflata TaxID=28002 RepID=A0AA86ULH4_9EUKA|nr:Hypothetical protein HINF_LOCUS43607 [Hexamita inflata]
MQTNQKNCSEKSKTSNRSLDNLKIANPLLKCWSNTKEEMLDIRWNKYWPRTKMMRSWPRYKKKEQNRPKKRQTRRIRTSSRCNSYWLLYKKQRPQKKRPESRNKQTT